MSVAVKLPSEIVADAKKYAAVNNRSIPKQLTHWAEIGQIAEDNPDLPYQLIRDILIAKSEETLPTGFSLDD